MKSKIFKVAAILVAAAGIIFGIRAAVLRLYPMNYNSYIQRYSKEYKLDPYLVAAVIRTESKFRVRAKSHQNAHGLMQITEDTAKWIAEQMKLEGFDLQKLYEPETNIRMGCWYLDNLRSEFKGDMELVLAAYNGGRGNVRNWLQNKKYSRDGVTLQYIPFKETDKYVKKVKVSHKIYRYVYNGGK